MSEELVIQALKFKHEMDKDDIIRLNDCDEGMEIDEDEYCDEASYDDYEWTGN